jgi:hypothetical protein
MNGGMTNQRISRQMIVVAASVGDLKSDLATEPIRPKKEGIVALGCLAISCASIS